MVALSIERKLQSAKQLLRDSGWRGLASALRYQPGLRHVFRASRVLRPSFWQNWDNPVLGRLVELRGDLVEIDGCSFDVASPAIRTGLKAIFLFDRYERAERRAIERYLDPQLPVVELGGALGVVACLTNRRLAAPDAHVVVEASPNVLELLEENRQRNGCRFAILHRAIAYGSDTVAFTMGSDFLAAHVAAAGELSRNGDSSVVQVPATSLRAILDSHGFAQCTLICDIEGAELAMVQHEADVLRERVRTIVMEVHPKVLGSAATAHMLDRLRASGFTLVEQEEQTVVLQRAAHDF